MKDRFQPRLGCWALPRPGQIFCSAQARTDILLSIWSLYKVKEKFSTKGAVASQRTVWSSYIGYRTTWPKGTTKSSLRLLKHLLQSLLFSTTGIRTCLQQMSIILQQGLGNLNQEKYRIHLVRLMKWHQIISKALVWINSIYTLILLQLCCLNSIYLLYSYIFCYLFGVDLCRAKSWNWGALWVLSNTGYFMILWLHNVCRKS